MFAKAALPERLRELVRTTVLATRLWSSEKADVARELIAHFEDGLEAGASAGTLLDDFGEVKRAARLIRRAKIRNRPLVWKLYRLTWRVASAVCAILLITYCVLAIRLIGAEPTLARNYLAELNAKPLAVPEDQRAWPLYREAALLVGKWPAIEDADDTPAGPYWTDWRNFAERSHAGLELIHRAARRPNVGAVFGVTEDTQLATRRRDGEAPQPARAQPGVDSNPMVISILLPQLSVLREAVRLAAIDARIGLLERDAERVVTDVETMVLTADHVFDMPFLISELVALAVLSKSCETIGTVLAEAPDLLSDAQLTQISHRLASVRGGGPIRVDVGLERVFFADVIQRMYTDDGNGDGRLVRNYFEQIRTLTNSPELVPTASRTLEWLALPAASAIIAGRREMTEKYEELMRLTEQEAATPLWMRHGSEVDRRVAELQESPLSRARYPLLALLFPSLSRASAMGETATLLRDGTFVALAAEAHRRRNGAYAAAIAELAPGFLPSVPLDRCDGLPLRYRLRDGRPVIYSIGGDLDDDGGNPPAGRDGNGLAKRFATELANRGGRFPSGGIPDGDWVIWPPVISQPVSPSESARTNPSD
jgi:hypothetical protein